MAETAGLATIIALPITRRSTHHKYAMLIVGLSIFSCIISCWPYFLSDDFRRPMGDQPKEKVETDDSAACDRPQPLPDTIFYADLKHHADPSLRPKIVLVGMKKSGTTSMGIFFDSAGFSKCDWRCTVGNKRKFVTIATCIRQAIVDGKPPLATCGDYDAYAETDVAYPDGKEGCFFPQIEALDAIHDENPSAVFVLNLRNVNHWTTSVLHWPPGTYPSDPTSLSYRLAKCEAGPRSASPEALAAWYCDHTRRIRDFVAHHPSHTLVEVDIEDAASGAELVNFFGVDHSHWQHVNKNPTKKRFKRTVNGTLVKQ